MTQQGSLVPIVCEIRPPDGTGSDKMLYQCPSVVWVFGLVQFLGWAGGLLARFSANSRHQSVCHAFFMLALVVVGISTSLAVFMGTKCWLLSASTLAGMILLAICDFDRSRRPATI
jgi:hypothetical protein